MWHFVKLALTGNKVLKVLDKLVCPHCATTHKGITQFDTSSPKMLMYYLYACDLHIMYHTYLKCLYSLLQLLLSGLSINGDACFFLAVTDRL